MTEHKEGRGHCHYHLCRKKTEVHNCKYCENYFCKEHLKPAPAYHPDFKHLTREDTPDMDNWREPNRHACVPYYDYLKKLDEKKRREYQAALNKLCDSGKPASTSGPGGNIPPEPTVHPENPMLHWEEIVKGIKITVILALVIVVSLYVLQNPPSNSKEVVVYDCGVYPDKCKKDSQPPRALVPLNENEMPPNQEQDKGNSSTQLVWLDIPIVYPEKIRSPFINITKINASITSLMEQLPAKHLNLEYSLTGIYFRYQEELTRDCRGEQWGGCYAPSPDMTSKIYIPLPEVIHDMNSGDDYYEYNQKSTVGGYYTKITNPANTLAHELAHGVYYTYKIDNWRFDAPFISDYAKTNEKEDFAETYAEYVRNTCNLYQKIGIAQAGMEKMRVLFNLFEKQIYKTYKKTQGCSGVNITAEDSFDSFFRRVDKKDVDVLFVLLNSALNETIRWEQFAKECNENPSRCDRSTALGRNSSYEYSIGTYQQYQKDYERKMAAYKTRWGEI